MTSFEILANEPITMSSVTGGFTTGRKITFKTNEGCTGIVKVADSLSVDDIRSTIMAEAQRLNDINGLT